MITGVSRGCSTFSTMESASTTALSARTAPMERSQAATMDARKLAGRKPAYFSAMPERSTTPPAAMLAAIWVRKPPASMCSNTHPAQAAESWWAPSRLSRLPTSPTMDARKPLRA